MKEVWRRGSLEQQRIERTSELFESTEFVSCECVWLRSRADDVFSVTMDCASKMAPASEAENPPRAWHETYGVLGNLGRHRNFKFSVIESYKQSFS